MIFGRRVVVAGVAVLGFALAGCGGEGDATTTIEVSDGPGGGEELFEAMAAAQEDAGSYRLEMEIAAGPTTITAEGGARFDEDSADMSLTMSIPQAGEMEMLAVDDVVYMSTGGLGLPVESPWLRIDPSSDDAVAQQFSAVSPQSSIDMQAYFNEYSDVIVVAEGGEDTVDGVEVTEYVVTIDVTDVDELPGMPQGSAELPFDEVSYSVWVDAEALVRKLTSELGGFGSMDLRLFDYGEPVGIEVPNPDDVTDISEVLGEQQSDG